MTPTATQLVIIAPPPTSITAGQGFGVTVAAEDASGNVDTTYFGGVVVSLFNNPSGGTLGGTTSALMSNGVASLTGLTLDRAGLGYTLQAMSGNLVSMPTANLGVTAGAAAQLAVTSPPPATVTAGQPFGITVAVGDKFGNTVTGFVGNLAVAATNSTLGGTLTAAVSNGVASFDDLSLVKAGNPFTLQVSATGLPPVTTSPFSVTAGPATQLVAASPPPATVAAGTGFGIVFAAEDRYGNVVFDNGGAVSVSLGNNPTGDTLAGTLIAPFSGGLAAFTGLTLDRASSGYTLQATTSGSLPTLSTSLNLSVAAGQPAQLVLISPPPTNVTAGVAFGLVLAAEDLYGNVAPGVTGSVTMALGNNPGGSILSGTTNATFSNGFASFTGLVLNKVGDGYTLQAASAGLAPSNTMAFEVKAVATRLVVASPVPSTVTAGTPFGLTLAAEDVQGNVDASFTGSVTVALGSSAGGGALGGNTSVAFSNGLASFTGLTVTRTGTAYKLLVATSGLTSPTDLSMTFAVTPAAASQLVVTTPPPETVRAGSSFGLAVTVEDQFGNAVTGYSGNLAVAPTSASEGALGGTLTRAVNGATGLAQFDDLVLVKSGAGFTLQVSAVGFATVTTSPFSVTAGDATRLVAVVLPPSVVTAGVGFGLQIAAEDEYGNVDPSFAGTVAVTLAPGSAQDTLVGTTTSRFSAGLATFAGLSLTKAAPGYVLQATSTGLTPAAPSTLAFSVKAGAAAQLVLTSPPPSTVTAGVPFSFVLAAEDPYGNIDPAFTGSATVALAINPGGATLSGTSNAQFSNGLAVFAGLSLDKNGSGYTLTASSSGLSPTTIGFGVSSAPVTQLVASVPSTVTAGQAVSVKVTAQDALGNIVTTYGGNVSVLGLAGAGTWVTGPALNGSITFTGPTYNTAGIYSLSIQGKNDDGSLTFSTTPTIAVTAAPATQLMLTSPPPSTIAAGSPFGLVLAAGDPYGNVDPSFAGSVTLALGNNPGGGALAGTANVGFSNGLATFAGLTLSKVGSGYTLLASSLGLSPVTSMFDVTSRVATRLVVTSPPSKVTAGAVFGLTLAAEDALGNVDPTYSGSVTVALGNSPGGGALGGTTNAQFSNGLVSFTNLTINKAGSGYTLLASSSGLAPPTSSDGLTFDVTAGTTGSVGDSSTATHLVVASPVPKTATVGSSFGLTIAAKDSSGNVDPTYTGSVTVALGNNPGGGILGGTATVQFSNGLASFTNLTINKAGSGYTLLASSSGLAPPTSSDGLTFNVTAGTAGTTRDSSGPSTSGSTTSDPARHLVVLHRPDTVDAGRYFQLTIAAEDAKGAIDGNFSGMVTLALAGNPTGATLGGNLNMPMAHGILTFYGLTLDTAGSGYTIRATASGSDPTIAPPITVINPAARIDVTVPPPSTIVTRGTFGLTIRVEDAFGVRSPGYNGSVTVTLAGKHGRGKLRGPRTVNAIDGVATFSGLMLPKARKGQTFQIQVTASGLAPMTTSPITVLPAPARGPHPSRGKNARLRA